MSGLTPRHGLVKGDLFLDKRFGGPKKTLVLAAGDEASLSRVRMYMIPAVRLPRSAKVKIPVEVKLKPNWHYDPSRRVFKSDSGQEFSPVADLPKKTKIVYQIPSLVKANENRLSRDERDLRRYVQVILPGEESPGDYLDIIRAWP